MDHITQTDSKMVLTVKKSSKTSEIKSLYFWHRSYYCKMWHETRLSQIRYDDISPCIKTVEEFCLSNFALSKISRDF